MKIDFNNFRKQTAYALDKVINTLNEGILPEKEYASHEQPNGKMKHWEGDVLISKEDLQKDIDELRSNIWILLCMYEEGNPDYQTVFEEVEKSGGLARFNDNDEEEN
ncbi:MAG: hypothetical protein WC026_13165 [Hyphomicrobium sp.]|uniref:hypothetical protein n=1 Tax=Hyphomicrobium sp. TaxID=82 RepID=UPI00356A38E0